MLNWDERERLYVWTGSVQDLVNTVANGDARMGFVVDSVSGAKIAMDISGDVEGDEPFNIESPDGQNLYDAANRKEAISILTNIRRGSEYPDMPTETAKRRKSKSKTKRSRKHNSSGNPGTSLGGVYI